MKGRNPHAVLPGTTWALWRQVVLRAPGFPAAGVERIASPALAEAADSLNEAEREASAGGAEQVRYEARFEAETERLNSQILGLAADRRFGLALAWQNHQIFETAIAPMLRRSEGDRIRRNSQQRQHEEVIASYWQRFCVKNDTVGFFGPVGWALLEPQLTHSSLLPGKDLIASSEVFFEPWAIDKLAQAIAALPGMAAWIPPRKLPFVRVEGKHAIGPARVPVELTDTELAVLHQCTGQKSAYDIAASLIGLVADAATCDDIYSIIARLGRKRLLTWKLELPISAHPERHLRQFLQRLGDPELAADGLRRLDLLEAARGTAQQSSLGDPAGFVAALRELDKAFMTTTDAAPSRRHGRAYGGRTLIYHDARRDVQLILGADFLGALEPLGLVLDSARWLTFNFASRLQDVLTGIAARMAADGAAPDLASFWFECMPVIYRTGPAIVREIQHEFQQRWAAILQVTPGSRRVRRTCAELTGRLRAAFEAPHSGWSAGRYYSPDLIISADSIDAINRGNFEIVLGELHLALPSIRHYCFVTQHPSPDDLLDCLAVDSPGPRLLPVLPKEDHERLTVRTQSALTRDEDFLVALADLTAEAGRPRLLDAADLTVTPSPGGPVVSIRGGPSFPVIDVFAEMIVRVIMNSFLLMPDSAHQPRIAIDRLVIARETWRFPAEQIEFARIRDEQSRYAAARNWHRSMGIPRRIFVKMPGETKPFFTDFDSLLSVNILAKSVRRVQAHPAGIDGSPVQVSEMLPSVDQLWLTDTAGNRYTSELRIVAVDQQGPGAQP